MSDRLDDQIFGGSPSGATRRTERHRGDGSRPRLGDGVSRGGSRTPIRVVSILLTLAIVGGAGCLVWSWVKPWVASWTAPKDYTGQGTTNVSFVVKQGDTGHQIALGLQQAGVVKTSEAFEDALASNSGSEIQPGAYTLKKEMSSLSALEALRDPASRNVNKVTVPEGRWKNEVFALLSRATGKPVKDYVEASNTPEAIGLPAAAKGNLEGYLFPATYTFNPDDTAEEQLQTMVRKAVSEMNKLGITEAKRERTLILASIVEAEGKNDADRAKIARVLENRLAKPMRLQLDSTVSYGIQKRTVATTDAARANPNKWNTYAHDGLPVGPIGNPGVSALKAAMNPTPGPWLFFVATNPVTGETKFAVTQAEHDRYSQEFLAWCNANPKDCRG